MALNLTAETTQSWKDGTRSTYAHTCSSVLCDVISHLHSGCCAAESQLLEPSAPAHIPQHRWSCVNPRLTSTLYPGSNFQERAHRQHACLIKKLQGLIKEILLPLGYKSNIYCALAGICPPYQASFEDLQTHPSYGNSDIPQLSLF